MNKLLIGVISMMIVGNASCSNANLVVIDGRTVLPGGAIVPFVDEENFDPYSPEMRAISERGKAEYERRAAEKKSAKKAAIELAYKEFIRERQPNWSLPGVNRDISEVKQKIKKNEDPEKLNMLQQKLTSLQKEQAFLRNRIKELQQQKAAKKQENK